MININQDLRPTVKQLIQIPLIALRISEMKLRKRHTAIKQNEELYKKDESRV
jgi:hypothetical protein